MIGRSGSLNRKWPRMEGSVPQPAAAVLKQLLFIWGSRSAPLHYRYLVVARSRHRSTPVSRRIRHLTFTDGEADLGPHQLCAGFSLLRCRRILRSRRFGRKARCL